MTPLCACLCAHQKRTKHAKSVAPYGAPSVHKRTSTGNAQPHRYLGAVCVRCAVR